MNDITQVGRPALPDTELETILQKLKPFLITGLSLPKACALAEIPTSNVYYFQDTKPWFLERINAYKAYTPNKLTQIFNYQLELIYWRIERVKELQEKIKEEPDAGVRANLMLEMIRTGPTQKDSEFLQWYAVNHKVNREEFGLKTEISGDDGKPIAVLLDTIENQNRKTNYANLGDSAKMLLDEKNTPSGENVQ